MVRQHVVQSGDPLRTPALIHISRNVSVRGKLLESENEIFGIKLKIIVCCYYYFIFFDFKVMVNIKS